jgi:trigger factor
MKHEFKEISATKSQLIVEIPKEKVSEEYSNVLDEIKKSIKIDGFRPGKIPKSVIIMRFGKEIRNQVAETLVEDSFPKLIAESGLELASQPEFGEFTLENDQPFKYDVSFEIIPKIEVTGYKGIKIEKTKPAVNDQELQDSLERVQESQATLEIVSDRAAQKSDQIFGKVTLTDGGDSVPGWTNRNMSVTIGAGQSFPGSDFEDKLTGAASGALHEYVVDFAKDYDYYAEFAGKSIHVKWDISEIKMKQIPEICDELAVELGLETLDQLKEQLKDDLMKQKTKHEEEQVPMKIVDALLSANTFDVTEYMVEKELTMMMKNSQFGDQSDNPELRKIFQPVAERNVKQRILMDQIAIVETIEATTEDVEKEFQNAVKESDLSETDLRKKWYDDGIFDLVRREIVRKKAYDFVVDNAEIKEVDTPTEESPESGNKSKKNKSKKEEKDEQKDE